jgi:hypothetical protein
VDAHYDTVPFPFTVLPGREFRIEVEWNLDQLLGYFNTWSSVQHFIKQNNYNPVDTLALQLQQATKSFYFPLFLKLGTI